MAVKKDKPNLPKKLNTERLKMAKLSDQEILEKAIQKAIENGWETTAYNSEPIDAWRWRKDERAFIRGAYEFVDYINVEAIIFNHDFAKALWGDELIQYSEEGPHTCTADMGRSFGRKDELFVYEYHLQMMVISDDPIKYLGEHLNG